MKDDFRREALLKTLREDYGITTLEQFLEAFKKIPKIDITQFVLPPNTKGARTI